MNIGWGHGLKLSPVWGQNMSSPSLAGGGGFTKSNASLSLGNRDNSNTAPHTLNIYTCYIYGCHFIISLFYLL